MAVQRPAIVELVVSLVVLHGTAPVFGVFRFGPAPPVIGSTQPPIGFPDVTNPFVFPFNPPPSPSTAGPFIPPDPSPSTVIIPGPIPPSPSVSSPESSLTPPNPFVPNPTLSPPLPQPPFPLNPTTPAPTVPPLVSPSDPSTFIPIVGPVLPPLLTTLSPPVLPIIYVSPPPTMPPIIGPIFPPPNPFFTPSFGTSTPVPGGWHCGNSTVTALPGESATLSLPTDCNNNMYCPNMHCIYRLCSSSPTILVHFTYMDIEDHVTCNFDYLLIDGEKYCGSTPPDDLVLTADDQGCAQLEFSSDFVFLAGGFSLSFQGGDTSPATPCLSNPCPAERDCQELASGDYHCVCPVGRTGVFCESSILFYDLMTTTEPGPGPEPEPEVELGFFETVPGYVVIGVICGAGAVIIIGVGAHLYAKSVRNNRVRPSSTGSRVHLTVRDDLEAFAMPTETARPRAPMRTRYSWE